MPPTNIFSQAGFYQALATIIIGLVAAFIAWRQWRLTNDKLRLDLFDRRYKVYEGLSVFLAKIVAHANFADNDLREMNLATRDAVFLFPEEVTKYIDEVRCRALEMRLFALQFEPLPAGPDRSALVQKNHNELVWLTVQLGNLGKQFSAYLGFAHMF
jgi:hypothetical protein